jgi:succinate dehydrogenase / fumarate reductase cytochrome b subunit
VTATQDAPGAHTPNIDVPPVRPRPRQGTPFPLDIYQTAVGKKWVMAITGIGLMGFVFAHMVGNLKMYLGPEEFNHYAEFLRELLVPILPETAALWLMRIGLIVMFVLHIHSAYSLTVMNRKARPTAYQSKRDYIAANWASRSMRVTGIVIALFLVFHLADLTWGVGFVNSAFVGGEAYDNVAHSLGRPLVAAIYIVANIALGVHLFHGGWSLFQSLGINNPKYNRLRKHFAAAFAAIIVIGNVSFPIMALAGVVSTGGTT